MGDPISQRASKSGMIQRLMNQERSKCQNSFVRLENIMNDTHFTSVSSMSSRSKPNEQMKNGSTFFKIPEVPIRHQMLRHQTSVNSTITSNSVKYAVHSLIKSFTDHLQAYLLNYEKEFTQDYDQSILLYNELHSIVSNAAIKMSSPNESQEFLPHVLFGKISQAFGSSLTSSQNCTTTNAQPDTVEDDFRNFSEDLQSTRIDAFSNENRTRGGSEFSAPASTAPKLASYLKSERVMGEKKENSKSVCDSSLFSNIFNNYSSIGNGGISNRMPNNNAMNPKSSEDSDGNSPDLSKFKLFRSKPDKNSSRIDQMRVKNTLTKRLNESSILVKPTPIANWSIRQSRDNLNEVELFGTLSRSQYGKPVSHGIVISRKGNGLIKTRKGLFNLVGPMKASNRMPSLVRKEFKTDFPVRWRKTLNDSGIFK